MSERTEQKNPSDEEKEMREVVFSVRPCSGVEWSGVEWSAVEWSGVEWSGVQCSGVEWSAVEWSAMHRIDCANDCGESNGC